MSLFGILHWIFGWIINIDVVLSVLFLVGFFLLFSNRFAVLSRSFIKVFGFLFLFFVVVPIGPWGATFLENRFPRIESIESDVVGAILLGGSFDRPVTVARGTLSYTPAAGRFNGFVELAKQNPRLKLVFTGGGVAIPGAKSESDYAKELFESMGFDTSSIIFEGSSKDTVQNATLSFNLVKPKPGEKWLLVTSALHMPRAVGLFEGAGWSVVPYPVDYHTSGRYDKAPNLSIVKAFYAWHHAIREFVAMTNNYINGYSKVWMPGPHS
ncbi:MAG: YdcF family protein [Candidatus Nucleicultricaceae bacterium]